MEKEALRIVYMGTPDFAVESLRALVEGGYNVVGVVTMPDKPAGRGYKIQYSPVKQYALAQGLPLLQPEKLKDPVFLETLRAWKADLQIVVAFRMLPEAVWDMPRLGTFNLHASLLPQYRGAAPINWAVINGEPETGVTTFFLTHEIDTGRIILQERLPIAAADDAGTVHDALMEMGARLVTRTVDKLLDGTAETVAQEAFRIPPQELRPAPKIFTETCRIDWHAPEEAVYNRIRGLSPYPAAWTELVAPDGSRTVMKVLRTERTGHVSDVAPGTVRTDGRTYFEVAVPNGALRVLSLQLAGKKRLPVTNFLNGFRLSEGYRVE